MNQNRRIVRVAPLNEAPRNSRIIDLRSEAIDEFVWFVFASVIMLGVAIGVYIQAWVISQVTKDSALLETVIFAFGTLFMYFVYRNLVQAHDAWGKCRSFDEKLARQRVVLARVIEDAQRSNPPLEFKDGA